MTELTCQQCQELAAELALDALPGDQRARAVAHLEGCATCWDSVSPLVDIADRLLELLPEVAPPAGFDQRVITALWSLVRPVPSRLQP